MADTRKQDRRIVDVIQVKDNRYPVNAVINTNDGDINCVWYFNPAEMTILNHIEELNQLVDKPTSNYKDLRDLINKISALIDDIFEEKCSWTILRYCDAEYTFLFDIVSKIRDGYNDFTEKAETAAKKKEAEGRKKTVEKAKKDSAAFLAGE